jgi:hypothetical protein
MDCKQNIVPLQLNSYHFIMFHFLFFLLLIGLVILLTVVFGVFGFLRMLFRGPRREGQGFFGRRTSGDVFSDAYGSRRSEDMGTDYGNDRREKIISDKEGEYVDYEEIK